MVQEHKERKIRRKSNKLLLIALVLVIILLLFQVFKVFRTLYQQGLEKQDLIEEREQLQAENDSLKSDLENKDDEDFIKRLARKLYGYVEEGERIFKDSNYSD